MFAEERHQHIVDTAKAAGRVDVGELAAALAVTTETIRGICRTSSAGVCSDASTAARCSPSA
jgi:hypothetical protein